MSWTMKRGYRAGSKRASELEPPPEGPAHAGLGGLRMSSRLACWFHGHDWGPWDKQVWENIVGTGFRVRWCRQCGAMDRRGA